MDITVHRRLSFDEQFVVVPRALFEVRVSTLAMAVTVFLYGTDGPMDLPTLVRRFGASEGEIKAALESVAAEGLIERGEPDEWSERRGFLHEQTEDGPLTLFGWS